MVIRSCVVRSAAELADLLRSSGKKLTPQRLSIIALLDGNDGHPTAEALHAEATKVLPTLSLKTVYTVLHELADLGEVSLLDVGTGATRFDPNTSAHHHLVCTLCGRIRDIQVEYPGLQPPADQRQGFVLGVAEVVFRGQCGQCVAPVAA